MRNYAEDLMAMANDNDSMANVNPIKSSMYGCIAAESECAMRFGVLGLRPKTLEDPVLKQAYLHGMKYRERLMK